MRKAKPKPERKKVGAPSLYSPRYIEIARKVCSNFAATNAELADILGVSIPTIMRWKSQHPEFRAACVAGKAAANERVVESLFARAVGYSYDAEKVFCSGGRIRRAKVREHLPPDVGAAIRWLTNRMPAEWRERHDVFVKNETADADKSPELLMYELMRDLVDCGAIELKDGVKLLPPGSVVPRRR
jgi:hypothetical protein